MQNRTQKESDGTKEEPGYYWVMLKGGDKMIMEKEGENWIFEGRQLGKIKPDFVSEIIQKVEQP